MCVCIYVFHRRGRDLLRCPAPLSLSLHARPLALAFTPSVGQSVIYPRSTSMTDDRGLSASVPVPVPKHFFYIFIFYTSKLYIPYRQIDNLAPLTAHQKRQPGLLYPKYGVTKKIKEQWYPTVRNRRRCAGHADMDTETGVPVYRRPKPECLPAPAQARGEGLGPVAFFLTERDGIYMVHGVVCLCCGMVNLYVERVIYMEACAWA